MAIKATKLQAEYRKAINRINSGFDRSIPVVDADQYINEAIDIIFENFAVKFQVNTTVRNHLRQLEVPEVSLTLTKKANYIEAKIPDESYYMCTRQYGIGTVEGCDDKRLIDIYVIQNSDLTISLKDPFYKPSYGWEESLMSQAGDNLLIYPGDIQFDEVIIDYLKKPNHIATVSQIADGQTYVNSDGKTLTEDIDFEVDSTFFWRKVVRLAAVNTLRDMGDLKNYQAQLQSILQFDKIFLQ